MYIEVGGKTGPPVRGPPMKNFKNIFLWNFSQHNIVDPHNQTFWQNFMDPFPWILTRVHLWVPSILEKGYFHYFAFWWVSHKLWWNLKRSVKKLAKSIFSEFSPFERLRSLPMSRWSSIFFRSKIGSNHFCLQKTNFPSCRPLICHFEDLSTSEKKFHFYIFKLLFLLL